MAVTKMTNLTPRMARVTFSGDELVGLQIEEPAASVRLLLPSPSAGLPGYGPLVIPEWNGNEFLLADGQRPTIRTFTPRRMDPTAGELDLDIVLHTGGAVSAWVGEAAPGSPAAVSGPGRGYTIDTDAAAFLLAGDETALPAMCQLLEVLPHHIPVHVIVEVVASEAAMALPEHPASTVVWVEAAAGESPGSALVPTVEQTRVDPGTKVWAAGEAAAMHRLRKHLFEERGLARSDATVRGYWKHGR
jgi:NADPH-dependent ferric siderophore reductase